jgi:hypothetical protein
LLINELSINISAGVFIVDNFHRLPMQYQTACTIAGVTETQQGLEEINPDFEKIRKNIVERLEAAYYEPIKEFCRGRRFRPSNDPYFRIL